MKQKLEVLIQFAVETLKHDGVIDSEITPKINLDRTRDPLHGDFASNLALILAKQANTTPRTLAEKIVVGLPKNDFVTKIEIAGPGFINFFIDPNGRYQIINQIHHLGRQFGLSNVGADKKVQVEFVSANPTGPLHVGHGRGAVYGSAIADLLTAVGFDVQIIVRLGLLDSAGGENQQDGIRREADAARSKARGHKQDLRLRGR